MLQRSVVALLFLLVGITLSASAAAPVNKGGSISGSDIPTLFTVQGSPRILAGGAQQAWRVQIDESRAMDAVFKGGMWLPDGAGGRVRLRYVKHILHGDGTWTWIGKVATAHGEQSAVITFGKGAVFGRIPQSNGYPLRLLTQHGEVSLLRTAGDVISRSATAIAMRASNDARSLPRRLPATGSTPAAADAQKQQAIAAAVTAANPVIDVMVAYTPGIVSEYGSVSAAVTRINNLVDITNQAYVDSKVNQSIRLVDTVQVNYPDNTSNDSALDDITGYDSSGNPVQIPASLQGIADLRNQYGADLVSLLRAYDNATDGGCGLAWIIGGNETPIVPAQDNIYGYSVVGDGSDGGYYCLDTSFAHELGHNMGDAHDRANADNPGAYPYSYGYIGNGTNGFATIMAYGSPTQTPLAVFSNPNISICQNTPCGVADSASNSADNAHSMNNTAALIAQFQTAVTSRYVHNDVNADGKSDLFWYSQNLSQMTYWLMNGATMASWTGLTLPAGYRPVAYGDFNGDGHADILFDTPGNSVYMWLSNGSGGFTSQFVVTHKPGSIIVGTGDVNHDGLSDIIWLSPSAGQATYWLMNGATMLSWRGFVVPADYQFKGAGDFNGDGYADMLWEDSARHDYMWLNDGNGGFTFNLFNTHQPGWILAGVGDANGDGKSDIFWYNQSIGQMTYWLMNGSTMTSWKGFSINTANAPAGIGDFNGDGRADVLWNQPNRSLWMWLGNTSGGYNSSLIVNYSTNYVPVNY